MMKFKVGERVMVPKDEPLHSAGGPSAKDYLGRTGTVVDEVLGHLHSKPGGSQVLIRVRYDGTSSPACTWEDCLVSAEKNALEQALAVALAPLFRKVS